MGVKQTRCRECSHLIDTIALPGHLENKHNISRSKQELTLHEWYDVVNVSFDIGEVDHRATYTSIGFIELIKKNTKFIKKSDDTKDRMMQLGFIKEPLKRLKLNFNRGCLFIPNIKEKDDYRYLTMNIEPTLSKISEFNEQIFETIMGKRIELRNLIIEFKELESPDDYDPGGNELELNLFSTNIIDWYRKDELADLRKRALELLKGKGFGWSCVEQKDNWIIIQETPNAKRVRINLTDIKEEGNFNLFKTIGILEQISENMKHPMISDDSSFLKNTLTNCGWRAMYPKHHRQIYLKKAIAIWGTTHIWKALMACQQLPWPKDKKEALEEDIIYTRSYHNQISKYRSQFDNLITMGLKMKG